jgi:L-cysteine S-thiosulfotransferase
MTRLTLMLALVAAGPVLGDVAPDEVAYDEYGAVEAPLTDQAGDPEAGKVVMTTRGQGNCIACHQVTELDAFPFHGNVGPSLDGIAAFRSEAELRGIVADAKHTFPETIMPSFYKTQGYIRPGDAFTGKAGAEPLPPLLTGQQIEDVVAYLTNLTE